jgi:hypothetical protein
MIIGQEVESLEKFCGLPIGTLRVGKDHAGFLSPPKEDWGQMGAGTRYLMGKAQEVMQHGGMMT